MDQPVPVSDRERTAVHEAGHCLYAWFTMRDACIDSVTIAPQDAMLGHVRFQDRDACRIPPTPLPEQAQHAAKWYAGLCLAGIAAEQIRFGACPEGEEWGEARAVRHTQWPDPDVGGPIRGDVYGQTFKLLRAPVVWRGVDALAKGLLTHGTLDDAQAWATTHEVGRAHV